MVCSDFVEKLHQQIKTSSSCDSISGVSSKKGLQLSKLGFSGLRGHNFSLNLDLWLGRRGKSRHSWIDRDLLVSPMVNQSDTEIEL